MQHVHAPYVNCHFCNARLSVPNVEAPNWKGGLERACKACENLSTYKRREVQPYLRPAREIIDRAAA